MVNNQSRNTIDSLINLGENKSTENWVIKVDKKQPESRMSDEEPGTYSIVYYHAESRHQSPHKTMTRQADAPEYLRILNDLEEIRTNYSRICLYPTTFAYRPTAHLWVNTRRTSL